MGALLVSVKTDWTALRQGTDFRLPETAGNIIFRLGPETSSFAPEQERIIFFLLASTKRTAETLFSLSHSATPAECRKGRVHFTKSVCKGGLGRINMFLKYWQEGLCAADTPKACHLSTSCMPWNKFTAGTQSARAALTYSSVKAIPWALAQHNLTACTSLQWNLPLCTGPAQTIGHQGVSLHLTTRKNDFQSH